MNITKQELIEFIKAKRGKAHDDMAYSLNMLMSAHESNFDVMLSYLEKDDNPINLSYALEFAQYNEGYEKDHFNNGEKLISKDIVGVLELLIDEVLRSK